MILKSHKIRVLSSWTVWGWVVMFCTFTLLPLSVAAQEKSLSRNLAQFLQEEMDFSKEDLRDMKEGKVVTKQMKTPVKQEVAIISVARINVPEDFFIQQYGEDKLTTIEIAKAEAWSIFSNPPELDDVKALTMPYIDLGELGKCKLGDCKLKAPADLIQAFSQLDKSSPDFKEQVDELFQKAMLEYVQDYLKRGGTAMIEYRDQKTPVRIAEEFQDLLKQSPYLNEYMPQLRDYLENFPNSHVSNIHSAMYWLVERFGGKAKRPTISINHKVVYQPSDREMIVASKQIYANHYYEASLRLTVMVEDTEAPQSGFYLMHINRSRIDVLRRVPRALAGELFKNARDLLHEKMIRVKENMEKLYQAR